MTRRSKTNLAPVSCCYCFIDASPVRAQSQYSKLLMLDFQEMPFTDCRCLPGLGGDYDAQSQASMTDLCSFSHTVIPKEGQPYPAAHLHKILPTQSEATLLPQQKAAACTVDTCFHGSQQPVEHSPHSAHSDA